MALFAMVTGADADVPARFSSPRSMATLLTLVETPFGAESCASSGAGGRAEVFSRESLADRESGVSEPDLKGRLKKAIARSGGGQGVGRLGVPGGYPLKPEP